MHRHRPDYDRIAALETEIYGRTFEHDRPEPQPQLRAGVRFLLGLRWLVLAEQAAVSAVLAPQVGRDWTVIFAEIILWAMTAFYWLAFRIVYGTRGNRPPSAYKAAAVKPPAQPGISIVLDGEVWHWAPSGPFAAPERDHCKVCREYYRDRD